MQMLVGVLAAGFCGMVVWKARGKRAVALFLSLFFLVGTGFGLWGWGRLERSMAARTWPRVQGTVVRSELHSRTDEDGTVYAPVVVYRYRWKGATYTSDRIWLDRIWSSSSWARHVLARYPVGRKVEVYVSPQSPEEAVLEPGVHMAVVFPLFLGVVFIFLSGGLMIFLLRTAEPGTSGKRQREPMTVRSPGPFLVFFGLAWLMLSTPWALQLIQGLREGHVSEGTWVGSLFVLLGILILMAGLSMWISGRGLKGVQMVLDPPEPRLGDRICLELRGLPPKLERLWVRLECVRIRRWVEDGEAEQRQEILWSKERAVPAEAIQRGRRGARAHLCMTLPAEGAPPAGSRSREVAPSLPTFLPPEARETLEHLARREVQETILWQVRVHVDRKGPDAEAVFPLNVRPAGGGGQRGQAIPEPPEEIRSKHLFVRPVQGGWVWNSAHYRTFSGGILSLIGAIIGTVVGGSATIMMWKEGILTRLLSPLPALFVVLGVFLFFHTLRLWGGSFRVRKRGTSLVAEWRWLGLPIRRTRIPLARLQSVMLQKARSPQDYHRVVLHLRGGKRIGWWVSFSQAEAEELVQAIRESLAES